MIADTNSELVYVSPLAAYKALIPGHSFVHTAFFQSVQDEADDEHDSIYYNIKDHGVDENASWFKLKTTTVTWKYVVILELEFIFTELSPTFLTFIV